MFIVLQQELQVAEDFLGLVQGLAFAQPLAGQVLSHFHDIGFGHRCIGDVGASGLAGLEFGSHRTSIWLCL